MSKIAEFFEKAEHDFKVIGQDIVKVISKLFGAQALTQLETTAETLLKSELGQAVLGDAETLLAQVTTGQISQQTAITSLAASTIAAAKKTGVALESSIATAVASLAIAKLSGVSEYSCRRNVCRRGRSHTTRRASRPSSGRNKLELCPKGRCCAAWCRPGISTDRNPANLGLPIGVES